MNVPAVIVVLGAMLVTTAHVARAHDGTPAETARPDTSRTPDRSAEFLRLAGEASRRYSAGDYDLAEQALRTQLEIQPDNGAVLYNLACCLGAMERDDDAGAMLRRAVEAGFSDLRRIEREPNLRAQRAVIDELRSDWSGVVQKQRDALVKSNKGEFGAEMIELRDDELRIVLLCAWDKTLAERALGEMRAIAAFARGILSEPPESRNEPAHTSWVVVILPRRDAFQGWATRTYGEQAKGSFNQIGGSYEHARKRLVAIDSGATMRHEFFHVLQYRWLERAGQSHPIWIMEGLASLVEDADFTTPGSLRPLASWRTNTAKRMEKSGSLPDISDLASMDQRRFAAGRPLANYASARSFFLFLYETRRLNAWWDEYTGAGEHNNQRDSSGVRAIEHAFARQLREVEREYRKWLRTLPDVAETIEPGMASLGVEVDAGQGEGPIVTRLLPIGRNSPLRARDVVLSIDNRPTRDIAELVRVLGGLSPGQTVRIEVRRGKGVVELESTLVTK